MSDKRTIFVELFNQLPSEEQENIRNAFKKFYGTVSTIWKQIKSKLNKFQWYDEQQKQQRKKFYKKKKSQRKNWKKWKKRK